MTMRRLGLALIWVCVLAAVAYAAIVSVGGESAQAPEGAGEPGGRQDDEAVVLRFMYWGSEAEKEALERMVAAFNESRPGIRVVTEHILSDNNSYISRLQSLLAANDLPDIAYMPELVLEWGEQGRLLDFTPYLDDFPAFKDRLPVSLLYAEPGKLLGSTTAGEIITMFYNREAFRRAGLSDPPAEAARAWTWEEFVRVAKRLTIDEAGRSADEAGFDPDRIAQYGVSFPMNWGTWMPLVASNGGALTDEAGMSFLLDRPEAEEVFQALKDLVYVHRVAPGVQKQIGMPGTAERLRSGEVAMAIDGQWSLLDVASTPGLAYGMAVLPKFKEPKTMFLAGATSIFATTKHPEAALEFYAYHNDPRRVDLYEKGLWMPIENAYYNDPAAIASWIDNPFHPPEYRTAALDYLREHAIRSPSLSVRNWTAIERTLSPILDKIWTDEAPVPDVLREAREAVEPLLQGKYPTE
ncbi:MAG TPA: sugar ABC transporter substrate-binding protein [Paenibacillus sp.]|nr:sugar ABC transporter substrate-binding protein [Paenibacillus sp.]